MIKLKFILIMLLFFIIGCDIEIDHPIVVCRIESVNNSYKHGYKVYVVDPSANDNVYFYTTHKYSVGDTLK